jgi:hypothetical protein
MAWVVADTQRLTKGWLLSSWCPSIRSIYSPNFCRRVAEGCQRRRFSKAFDWTGLHAVFIGEPVAHLSLVVAALIALARRNFLNANSLRPGRTKNSAYASEKSNNEVILDRHNGLIKHYKLIQHMFFSGFLLWQSDFRDASRPRTRRLQCFDRPSSGFKMEELSRAGFDHFGGWFIPATSSHNAGDYLLALPH